LGHLVEVRLPDEIRTVRLKRIESRTAAKKEDAEARAAANLEGARVAWNATLRKEKSRPMIFSAASTASAA